MNYLSKVQIFGIYLGQKALVVKSWIGIIDGNIVVLDTWHLHKYIHNLKLILRTFEDMTEEEIKQMIEIRFGTQRNIQKAQYNKIAETFEWLMDKDQILGDLFIDDLRILQIEYLISIGIDVFNAIEQGWAVREKEVKQ